MHANHEKTFLRGGIRGAFLIGFAVMASGLVLAIGGACAHATFIRSRIPGGVWVSGIDVSGKTPVGARTLLEQKIKSFSSGMSYRGGNMVVTVPLDKAGIYINLDDAMGKIGAVMRPGLIGRLETIVALKKHPLEIPLEASFDATAMARFFSGNFGAILENPAIDADVSFEGGKTSVTPSQNGIVVNREIFKHDMLERLKTLQPSECLLKTVPDLPAITTADAETIAARIKKTVSATPYFIFGGGQRFTVTREQVINWISVKSVPVEGRMHALDIAYDRETIDEYLSAIAPALGRPWENAVLSAAQAGAAAHIAKPSEDSLRLNLALSRAQLIDSLNNARRSIDAMLDAEPAPINEKLLAEKGITHLIGRGESDFAGSSKSRKQNISVATEKYAGIFVDAGSVFAFDEHLGEIGAKSGYVPELVIKSKKLIPEYGGGICQVSTTLFRAAVNAGMTVIERSSHSIPVSYYGKPGFDATVYPPQPDLKFINSSTGTIFIQPLIDGTKLYFDIYGTLDGRTVKIEGPKTTASNPDGSIKTVVTQKVYRGDKLVYQKQFWSFYKSPKLYTTERNPLE
jgi:vancomycin resistance protein YoaR